MVLGPDREDDRDAAVNADGRQGEHAGVHVKDEEEGVHFAHAFAEYPVVAQSRVADRQRQEDVEQEVSDSQVEEPDGTDGLLHLEDDDSDDQPVTQQAQETSDAVDENG